MSKTRLVLGLIVFVAGCTGIPTPAGTHETLASATPTVASRPTLEFTPTPYKPTTLVVWLPEQFAPVSGSPAGEILKQRLAAFSQAHSDVNVEVRVKAMDGAGGLLDSLTTASAAAPLSLPDLIALPRPLLETAALKGLLHAYDNLIDTPPPGDTDWYDYASGLARLQDSRFGLPFAGDAIVLVFRNAAIPKPPATLDALLEGKVPLAFPAGDSQALFTLALYQAAGGKILDEEGRPVLEKEPLTRVLAFYQAASQSGVTPFWLTQFQTDDGSWEAFQKGQADMVITWASRFLQRMPQGTSAAPIPTLDGKGFTLATGWVWALSSPHPESQKLAAELAVFLSQSEFLGDWTVVSGFLPPRPDALSRWPATAQRAFIQQVSTSAHLVPSADVLPALSAPLSEATVDMLKLQGDPASAAQTAVNSLLNP
jgi:ABC-type glycerol-3-phosphate transport system substrate-binding protein